MNLSDLPKITFAEADPEQMDLDIVGTVEEFLERKLERADPLRLFLRGIEAVIIQQRLLIDQTAKQNLLRYAKDDALEHLGAFVGVSRIPATSAVTTIELTLSAAREQVTVIPQGMRVTAGDSIYFAIDEEVVFAQGETVQTVSATCQTKGETGNGYRPGELSRIVDPQPFLQAATNLTASEGGADVETNDALRERIHEAPESFSVAGPRGAYRFFVKEASSLIADVGFDEDAPPGEVHIYPLLRGGNLPEEEMLAIIDKHLDRNTKIPFTDKVVLNSPRVVSYDIEFAYYIAASDISNETAIQKKAETAVDGYISWQKEKLGRDIDDLELRYRLRSAGVKRVEIASPQFTKISDVSVAVAEHVSIRYGGAEDD